MSALTYVARLVPCWRWTRVTDPDYAYEMFDSATFVVAAAHPEDVIVDHGHREQALGRLTRLWTDGAWWRCTFKLGHRALEHLVADDQALSISFTPVKSSNGHHRLARLNAVSLVDHAMYPDARVVQVVNPADPALREPPPDLPDDLRERLLRLGIGVTIPKPKPAPSQTERENTVDVDPWLRKAQESAAARGVLIRRCGHVHAVR